MVAEFGLLQQTSGGGLSTSEQQLATAILLGIIFLSAVVVGFYYRQELYEWFNTIPRAVLGTVGAALTLGTVTIALLFIWGKGEELLALIQTDGSTKIVLRFLITVVILMLSYGASELFSTAISRIAERRDAFDDHSEEVAIRLAQVISFSTGILLVPSVWNLNIGNFLIGAGFLGVIVGFAARQTLSSALSGFMLMLAQPFKIGDWIEIGEKRGRVMKITVVNTHIRAATGEMVIIPNDEVMNDKVTNLSGMGRLQLYVDVGVDYTTDIKSAKRITQEAVEDVDDTMDNPGATVYADEFSESSVILRTYFWIDNPSETRRRRARAAVIREIRKAYDEEGITIPFPQRTLSNRDGDRASPEQLESETEE